MYILVKATRNARQRISGKCFLQNTANTVATQKSWAVWPEGNDEVWNEFTSACTA